MHDERTGSKSTNNDAWSVFPVMHDTFAYSTWTWWMTCIESQNSKAKQTATV